MRRPILVLAIAIMAGVAVPARAQYPASIPRQPATFASWQPAETAAPAEDDAPYRSATAISRRGRRALIGGVIGTVAGLAVCTVISNLTDEGAEGVSTCTWKGYLLTGGIGFGVGFAAGWLL